MAKIVLNNEEFNFSSYNRNTYFGEEGLINSAAYINNISGTNIAERLQTLALSPITSVAIKVDDTIIYQLSNVSAQLSSMEETYNGSDAVTTNLNLQFNQ